MRSKITILTFDERVIRFYVDSYKRVGDSVEFIDERSGLFKSFPANRCQIEEVDK